MNKSIGFVIKLTFQSVLSIILLSFIVNSSFYNSTAILSAQAHEDVTLDRTEDIDSNKIQSATLGSALWQDIDISTFKTHRQRLLSTPKTYRAVMAQLPMLDNLLSQAPMENSLAAQSTDIVLPLPLPDGIFGRFRLEESPIMEPMLAAKFPEIKTYRGFGIDDPAAVARLDRTPLGFHAMILSNSGTIYIDPYSREDVTRYISYFARDYNQRSFEEKFISSANFNSLRTRQRLDNYVLRQCLLSTKYPIIPRRLFPHHQL